MSLISRLIGKPGTTDPVPAADVPAPAPTPSRPDPVELARADEERLAAALASGSPEALSACVLESHSTRARQHAASLVSDPDHLRELIRLTRGGKDNSVYRILTATRDAQLSADRNLAARRVAIEALIPSLARRTRLPYDPLYEPSLTLFLQDWNALAAHATAEEIAQVEGHFATMRAVIARHHQALADAALREQAEAAARLAAIPEPEEPAAVAATPEPPPPAEPAPTAETAPSAPPRDAARPLIALLRQAQAALDRGGTARAQQLRRTLAGRLDKPVELPAWFERQLHQLDARLAELKDWKTFTVEPKRAELVERMQSLVGATISPEELARHIRGLQEEWRTLQRGAADETSAEATTFREAAHRAYAPCKEHFARAAALRQENQAKREAILGRLAAYAATLAAENPDWRQVARTISEARAEWRACAPVDNAVAPLLQERLRVALAELQDRLEAEYARNVAAREELIGRAQALLLLTDMRQAIEGAKSLQKLWRALGPVAQKQSNALWDRFRGHCDAVFQRSAQEAASFGAALAANQSQAIALCEAVEAIASLAGAELRAAMQGLEAQRAAFDALELPRQSARELRQRFERATGRCAEAVRRERAASVQRASAAVFDAATAIRAYALAVAQSADAQAAHAAAVAAVAGLAGAPKSVRTTLEHQLAQVVAGKVTTDLSANEAALRLLCIRAELVADVETPESDRDLRREYQMRRLLGARGLGADLALTGLDELALEWLTIGPVDPSAEAALRARFERCRG